MNKRRFFVIEQYNNGKIWYCNSLSEDEDCHDKTMSSNLGITYEDYLIIMKDNNGIQFENDIENSDGEIENCTDTWFIPKFDCLNAIEDLKEILK